MKLCFVNESTAAATSLTKEVLSTIAGAISRQLNECYAELWQSQGCQVGVAETLNDVPSDASAVIILDDADQAGALGYHDTTPDGRPYAKVFLKVILDNGGTLTKGSISLSAVLSHECLEAAGDPYINWWAQRKADNKLIAIELGDPVEADSYEIDGIAVSNFVGPRYFSEGPGPYDWMGTLTAPWTMTPGGYQIVMDTDGSVSQVFGESYPEWKKAGKLHPASRTSKRISSKKEAA